MDIHMKGVHHHFSGRGVVTRVLDGLDLHIPSGEFISVMGPSGSGKTTLLNLIGCLDYPAFGDILLKDTNVSKAPESLREQIRLHHIGFVFQNYNLLPTLSVLENVLLPMELARTSKDEMMARGGSLLRLVGLDKQAQQQVGALSGGQKQRVAIARALANLPELLLADEPTGNLDGKASKEIMEVLKSINNNKNLTTVLVTHDPMVASYASSIYHLESGLLRRSPV